MGVWARRGLFAGDGGYGGWGFGGGGFGGGGGLHGPLLVLLSPTLSNSKLNSNKLQNNDDFSESKKRNSEFVHARAIHRKSGYSRSFHGVLTRFSRGSHGVLTGFSRGSHAIFLLLSLTSVEVAELATCLRIDEEGDGENKSQTGERKSGIQRAFACRCPQGLLPGSSAAEISVAQT